MMNWHLGTMGYGYKDWVGVFYPHHARPNNYLLYYSKIFDSVEMDTTFYGIPSPDRVRSWSNQTPDNFIFCPKTPREITHEGEIDENIDKMHEFIEAVRHFGGRLGAILMQFPPRFTIAHLDALATFLRGLPGDVQFAAEFRHNSWDMDEVRALLRETGVCWVSAEYIVLPQVLHITADFAYIRFLGKHGQFERKNRIQRDVNPILKRWWTSLQLVLDDLHTVYGFFNNDFSGHSPSTCNSFKNLIGLPAREPDIPVQGKLF